MYLSLFKEITVIIYLMLCVICDIRTYKIPNFIHLFFLLVRLLMILFEGIYAIAPAFIGILLPLVVLFPLFVIRAIGAGDIKMCQVVCFFYGYDALWKILWYTLIIGSIMSVIKIITCMFNKAERSSFYRLVDFLDMSRLPKFHKIHLSIAIAIASSYVLFLKG